MTEEYLDTIVELVREELENATAYYEPFHSMHEGFAILKEEVDELWECVKMKQSNFVPRNAGIRREAIQVAAMAIRMVLDLKDFPQEVAT